MKRSKGFNVEFALGLLLIVAVIGGVGAVERFKWKECRKVGHSALYCVFKR